MGKKPVVVFGRPHQWAGMGSRPSSRFEFVHVPIFGPHPHLRDGSPMADSVGGVVTDDGMEVMRETFRHYQPEVFLFWPMYADDGTPKQVERVKRFLSELRTISPKTKFIYGNGNQQGVLDFNVDAFKEQIDVVLTNTRDPRDYHVFKQAGIPKVGTFYQFGFDPIEHGSFDSGMLGISPEGNGGPYDCLFAGSQTYDPNKDHHYPNSWWRYEFICRVNHQFRLLVHGKGRWPFPHKPYVHGRELYDAYCRARIVLGANHWDLNRYYTRRTVYALASGRLYIVRYVPGMEKDFENRKHLVWFTEVEEGLDLIKHYLGNEKERLRIGREGRELAVKRFSWAAMACEFERVLDKIL